MSSIAGRFLMDSGLANKFGRRLFASGVAQESLMVDRERVGGGVFFVGFRSWSTGGKASSSDRASSSSESGITASLLMGRRSSVRSAVSGVLKRSAMSRLEDDCGDVAIGEAGIDGRGLFCAGRDGVSDKGVRELEDARLRGPDERLAAGGCEETGKKKLRMLALPLAASFLNLADRPIFSDSGLPQAAHKRRQ
jgi:hypothetical protein